MDKDPDDIGHNIGQAGTRFFGKISATVSHEIKNGLAVINENAGLLKDLMLMAEKGRPLDPTRITSIADKILERVARADEVVRNLNLFAHKVDDPLVSVDLCENMKLLVELTSRIAANREKTIRINPPQSPVCVTTDPFILLNLCWCCLETAMDATKETHAVTIDIHQLPDAAEIRIGGIDDGDMVLRKFEGKTERMLAASLGAAVNTEGRAVVLTLPMKLSAF